MGAGGGPSSKMVGGGGRCSPFMGWGVQCGCWCWAVLTVGMGLWWAVFIICRGSVGADSGLLSSFVGAGSWGGAGPCSPLVGWCW